LHKEVADLEKERRELKEKVADLEREDRELQEELDRRDEADADIGAALSSCAARSVIASL
jgi:chromosome segregation ATPase